MKHMTLIYGKRLVYLLGVLFFFGWFLCASASPAQAASPLAVVQSERNAASYQDQHLGNFDEAWAAFRQTLQNANMRFDLLSDRDISQGAVKLKDYKVILVPLLVDLPSEAVFSLTEYLKGGGK